MRISGLLLFSIATLAGCAELDTSATAQESHSWGGYHWARTSNPLQLKIGDNVNSAWDAYLNGAISDWDKSNVLALTKVTGQATDRKCSPTAGRVEVCNNSYGNNGWLGIASIWLSSGHISQGTTKLNDSYFGSGSTYDTPAWRALVTCQEVGHDFGLDHQDTNFNNANLGTCMDYTNNPSTNQHPNQHDYDELATIYSHTDSTNSSSLTAGAVADDDEESPAKWGEIITADASGRGTEFVRPDGQGGFVLTHVFWVPHQH